MSTTTTPKTLSHWIGGRADTGSGDRFGEVTESATGEVVARVPFATQADVDRALALAAEAAKAWGSSSLSQRTKVMFAFREQVNARRDELARAITREHGKVLSDAAGEVQRGMEVIDFACGLGHLLKGEMSDQVSRGVDSYSLRQPLGVVAGITPFNFPVMVPLWMAPVALACGNAFVLKPSEQDPSASLLLAEMLAEAGLPDGVFTVLNGDKDVVNALLVAPEVSAVSFVGSTPIARHVYESGTAHGKRVQALGGAKNHMVVLPDADLDGAADAAVSAAYGSAGERCMAISVVVAVGSAADPLVAAITSKIGDVVIGPGDQAGSMMGPVITAAHRDRVRSYVAGAADEGARVVVDGSAPPVDGDGFFLGCSLLDGVEPGMKVYDDEIFGPVLCVVRVPSLDDAIGLVNANPYGNGVALFTRDGGAARRFQREIEVGMVGINVPIPVPVAWHSFGGWKASIFGDTAIYGPEGVRFYTKQQVVSTRWPDPAPSRLDLGFPTTR